MSPAFIRVRIPAHRPTWLSNPSAATTQPALMLNSSSSRFTRTPVTRPLSFRSPTAVVFTQISAPPSAPRGPPLLPVRAPAALEEVAGAPLAAPHRGADLLALLDHQGAAAALRGPARGLTPGGTRAHDHDVVLQRHVRPRIVRGLKCLLRLSTRPPVPSATGKEGLLQLGELVPVRIVDRPDGADLHAHPALRAVLVEREVDLVQEDRVRRAGADAGPAVHAEHVVDRHDAVVPDVGTQGDELSWHAASATPRPGPRTSSRLPRGSSGPCCRRRTESPCRRGSGSGSRPACRAQCRSCSCPGRP